MRIALTVLGFAVLAALIAYGAWYGSRFEFSFAPVIEPIAKALPGVPGPTLLVGGDVMLGRKVEQHIRANGLSYPFTHLTELFKKYDAVLINFEGTVPKVHVPTPSMGFSFSFAEDIVRSIHGFGVTHAGLANNHAFDFGSAGHAHAKEVLSDAGVIAFGHPKIVSPDEVRVIEVGDTTLAFIPMHAVFDELHEEDMEAAMRAASTSDFQIVFVHWGPEYELVHAPAQERMAVRMAALGADVIIGHHPHVVQDVSMVGDTLVFYSLGNLIFDQYWEESVRTGLMLGIREEKGRLAIELIPTESITQSMPDIMTNERKEAFLEALAARSAPGLRESIRKGAISY